MGNSGQFKLDLTTTVQVQRPGAAEHRHTARLLGNVGAQYLILQAVGDLEPAEGEALIVRLVLGHAVVGFQTTVREVTGALVKLALVDYPKAVETLDLRQSDRLTVFVPTDVRATETGPGDVMVLQAVIVNLSAGGCCFSSKTGVRPDAEVSLTFTLPGQKHLFSVTGKVVQSAPTSEVWAQRVQFRKEPTAVGVLKDLQRWIQSHLSFAVDAPATAKAKA